MQPCRQTRGSSGSVCFIADSDTLKPENVLHYTFTLGSEVCSHCLMDPHSTGQQGVALLLRLTSTRLFLAEDLLTAHLTLWSAHERQLTVADSWNTPSPHFPIRYLIDCLHLMRTSTNFQMTKPEKSLVGGYRKKISWRERLVSSQLMETSGVFGEALEGVRVGGRGQRLSIEAWFMIYSVLHVCSQVSGSYTQLEQQGLGVCFFVRIS